MEDPNKAALERIRLAIPRYRPGSGNGIPNSNNINNAQNYTTNTTSTTTSIQTNNNNVDNDNEKSGRTTVGKQPSKYSHIPGKLVNSSMDTNDTDEFEAEREIFANLTANKLDNVKSYPHIHSSSTTAATSTNSKTVIPSTTTPDLKTLTPSSSSSSAVHSSHPSSIPLQTSTSVSSTQAQLMSSMTTRLQTVENAQKNLRTELVMRDREILTLKKQLEDAQIEARANQEALTQAQSILESSSSSSSSSSTIITENKPSSSSIHSSTENNNKVPVPSAIQAATAMADREKRYRNDIAVLQEENASLRLRLSEMEQFLLDYGLVWVGGGGSDNSTSVSIDNGGSTTSSSNTNHNNNNNNGISLSFPPIDFPVLIFKLKQLNNLAGEGKAQIIQKNGAHQFVQRDTIKLLIYADGFLLHRGPFRHWSESSSQMFLNDILDGYFPSEFQDTYPNGIIFDIQDKHNHYHNHHNLSHESNNGTGTSASSSSSTGSVSGTNNNNNDTHTNGNSSSTSFIPFGGEGNKLVNNNNNSRPSTAANDSRVHSLSSIGDNQFYFGSSSSSSDDTTATKALSKEEFLNNLPTRSISKDGNIVNIRENILSTLGVNSNGSTNNNTTTNTSSRTSSSGTTVPSTNNNNNTNLSKNSVLIETSVLVDMRNQAQDAALAMGTNGNVSPSSSTSPLLPYEVTTLQIRIDNNNRSQPPSGGGGSSGVGNASILIVKLKYDNTVAELRQYLDQYFAQFNNTGTPIIQYELRSAVPPRAYTDNGLTLRQVGLVPNATLVLRRL